MLALLLSCVVLMVVGLVMWVWPVWFMGLLGLVFIAGDITWAILSFAQAKRAGEGQLKF